MPTHQRFIEAHFGHPFAVIDTEFDRFELNTEFEETLRDVEAANFYHNALDSEE